MDVLSQVNASRHCFGRAFPGDALVFAMVPPIIVSSAPTSETVSLETTAAQTQDKTVSGAVATAIAGITRTEGDSDDQSTATEARLSLDSRPRISLDRAPSFDGDLDLKVVLLECTQSRLFVADTRYRVLMI